MTMNSIEAFIGCLTPDETKECLRQCITALTDDKAILAIVESFGDVDTLEELSLAVDNRIDEL